VTSGAVALTGTVTLPTTTTISGQNLCRADGTNCPSAQIPTVVSKGSPTGRTSTTTFSADPDLVFTAPSTGNYDIVVYLQYNGTTTGTQGFKWCLDRNQVGSDTGGVFNVINNIDGSAAVTGLQTDNCASGSISDATIQVSSSRDSVELRGSATLTSGVQYAVEWAQVSSSANATNLVNGYISYVKRN
jgi:hypothetical protein